MILTAIECCRSHIVLPIVGFVILLMTLAVWGQTGWDQYYGDSYVAKTRDCRDISNFFILEGPGNENPGNWMGLANPNIPDNIKDYIARQFKYVLFDQESFAVRSGRGSPVVSMMPPMYHSEARALMNRNPDLIVFPYFSFTLGRNDFPWMRSIDTTWILHEKVNPSARIKAGDPGYFLMDIRSAGWRNYFVSYIRDTVSHYGYRGVFLDNMTHYPFIQAADTTQLPAGAFGGWQHHLIDFLNTLRAELDPSVKVVCNSLGIDGTAPNAIPLFGPDHGKNLMPYVNGGAQIEEFHGTAWKAPLDSILSIMKYLRDSSKVFLAATHYYRGGDALLSQQFNLEPSGPRGWIDNATRPPHSTFYRMQMSYLARYLLVTAGTNAPPFGYSFQPGVTLYEYIPYYKPWDEQLGAPLATDFEDRGTYYERDFDNAVVYVNKSEALPQTVAVPEGGKWYWYPYYGSVGNSNVIGAAITSPTIELNPMEGIVLFRKLLVGQ